MGSGKTRKMETETEMETEIEILKWSSASIKSG